MSNSRKYPYTIEALAQQLDTKYIERTFATLFKTLNPEISQTKLEQVIKLTDDMHPKPEKTNSYKK